MQKIDRNIGYLPGWEEAEWFEVELVFDKEDPARSIRTIKPASFVPKHADEKFWGKRPSKSFRVTYRGCLTRKDMDKLFRQKVGTSPVCKRAEAAALAVERIIKRRRPLSDKEIVNSGYKIPRGAISKCYPYDTVVYFTRVLPNQRTFRVDMLESDGGGWLRLGTNYHRVYVPR